MFTDLLQSFTALPVKRFFRSRSKEAFFVCIGVAGQQNKSVTFENSARFRKSAAFFSNYAQNLNICSEAL